MIPTHIALVVSFGLVVAACATPLVIDRTNPASPEAPEAPVPPPSVLERAAQGPLFPPGEDVPSHHPHTHGSHE